MSKAFTKEDDGAEEPLPDREISPHRNLVTEAGLAQIVETVEALEADYAKALDTADRDAQARIGRDLRYWSARRGSAEVVSQQADTQLVHFGSAVEIVRGDGRRQTFRIVGEDEANPAEGTLSYVSPLAQALMGRETGDNVRVGAATAAITSIS